MEANFTIGLWQSKPKTFTGRTKTIKYYCGCIEKLWLLGNDKADIICKEHIAPVKEIITVDSFYDKDWKERTK